MCIVVKYKNAIMKSTLDHSQVSWSLGPGSQQRSSQIPPFLSKATPNLEPKWVLLLLSWPKPPVCMVVRYGCHYKVNVSSWARLIKFGKVDFSQHLPYSTKAIHYFEENGPLLLLLLPKAHICRLVLHHLNYNISPQENFMKTGRGVIGRFLSKFTIFYKANPCFWRNPTNCVATLAQRTCVYCCRLVLHYLLEIQF